MKIKTITIENEAGDEFTMTHEEAEKFIKAFYRLKDAAKTEPKDSIPEEVLKKWREEGYKRLADEIDVSLYSSLVLGSRTPDWYEK
jgi:hypothetical protein